MQILNAVVTGAIQGLSEFLPISSSAHITFSNYFFELFSHTEISQQEEIFFDILVHFATLCAVLLYFKNDLNNIVESCIKKNKEDLKLVGFILLGTFITGVIGLLIKKPVEHFITNPVYICIFLFITGIVLLLCEKSYKGDKKISLKSSIVIAIAQGLAVFPGFSRSGFTISAAIFQGIDRFQAARYSFLLSIPVIFLASLVYPMMELDVSAILQFNLKALFFGSLTAFIVGYLCIKYFMEMLKKMTLKFFGYYCLFASLLMFVLFQVFRQV